MYTDDVVDARVVVICRVRTRDRRVADGERGEPISIGAGVGADERALGFTGVECQSARDREQRQDGGNGHDREDHLEEC